MRIIEYSSIFKKDYKRENKSKYSKILDIELQKILLQLTNDISLSDKYRDHNLGDNWSGYRECHIKPDLLLIYSKAEEEVLKLARLGSHSNLFK